MPPPSPTPAPRPDEAGKTGVLLINLGTPDAPTVPAVRRYLRELLSDPGVVRLPRILWQPILHGIVLRVRPRRLAERYAAIWTLDGSPLKWHTERQAELLGGLLARSGRTARVDYAMRYGQPSIPAVLSRLSSEGCARILLLPLYPQYSASTTATALDAARRWADSLSDPPELRAIRGFAREPDYIAALAASVRRHWAAHGRPASSYRLLMSFHGIPARAVESGDPYHDECLDTARLLSRALNLDEATGLLSFQSRFGGGRWLQPDTSTTLENLGRQGIERVDVLCPGFPADCLETLEEIAIAGKSTFLRAGGRTYFPIPCLNESDDWIHALKKMLRDQRTAP
ncbi:MAG: ferrochelatase [Candidatus Accumulibacter sp.]|jgi:ferrochelatase|nr:ferrochelatase [Accumulibacter sp.]